MMSANGPISSKLASKLKLKRLGSQEFVVLDNTPNVLFVGALIEQGYSFYWVPGSVDVSWVLSNGKSSVSQSTGLDKSSLNNDNKYALPQKCFLVTPSGTHIRLNVRGRVPVLE